jgi:hypothetical protein
MNRGGEGAADGHKDKAKGTKGRAVKEGGVVGG